MSRNKKSKKKMKESILFIIILFSVILINVPSLIMQNIALNEEKKWLDKEINDSGSSKITYDSQQFKIAQKYFFQACRYSLFDYVPGLEC